MSSVHICLKSTSSALLSLNACCISSFPGISRCHGNRQHGGRTCCAMPHDSRRYCNIVRVQNVVYMHGCMRPVSADDPHRFPTSHPEPNLLVAGTHPASGCIKPCLVFKTIVTSCDRFNYWRQTAIYDKSSTAQARQTPVL